MDKLNIILLFTIILAIIGFLLSITVFKRAQADAKMRQRMFRATATGEVQTNGTMAIMIVFFIFILIICIVGFVLWSSMQRYKVASTAVQQGNTGVALAALAPDISSGINALFGRR